MRAARQNVANVYIGYDTREREAYEVAHYTLARAASCPLRITPLCLHQLEAQGLYYRPRSRLKKGRRMEITEGRIVRHVVSRASAGTMWDILSQAPMSTEFANSRFLVPLLAQTGWAAFMDCDVIARGDVAELFALADPQYAVMVVKHPELAGAASKMDGQPQLAYARKNWSSVMLFNCDHPSNRRLTLNLVNREPGRLLHKFSWLYDDEIGALPLAWNWLVNVSPCPADWKVAHFTLGGPWLAGWSPQNHDDLWLSASADFRTGSRVGLAGTGKAVA
jgi:hypothetical protein